MLLLHGSVYEVFEYINGVGYDSSLEATQDAGKTLGLFHKLVKDHNPDGEVPSGSYHASKTVVKSIKQIAATIARVFPHVADREAQDIDSITRFMYDRYVGAAKRLDTMGLNNWPPQIIHCDWHPGNMLFRGTRVVAVIDYDAARLQQPIVDAANGALQFSILGGGDDPSKWPDYIDVSRFKRFLKGYDSVTVLSKSELRALPLLMTEALIAEAVIPIAATGYFSRMEGLQFLRMIVRKVNWLEKNAEQVAAVLE